jgi:hypothetical protein
VLSFSWLMLYMLTIALTEIWLVPWDIWSEPVRPPVGTWQRTVNDFFEGGVGAQLVGVSLIAGSMFSILIRLLRGDQRTLAPWIWASYNLIFFTACLVTLLVANSLPLNNSLPIVEQIGYGRTWPGVFMLLVGGAVLLAIQFRMAYKRRPAAQPEP